jgi:hypothetical protein
LLSEQISGHPGLSVIVCCDMTDAEQLEQEIRFFSRPGNPALRSIFTAPGYRFRENPLPRIDLGGRFGNPDSSDQYLTAKDSTAPIYPSAIAEPENG